MLMKRQPIKTKIPEIVNYWFSRIDESDFSVDAAEAHERCWRCGCKRHLERCHIVPDSLGGKDEPSNLVLLCARCHKENPNVGDPEIMWDWLKAYKVPFYDTLWSILGLKEYHFIYNRSFYDDLAALGLSDADQIQTALREIDKNVYQQASVHFGQPYFNTATVAGLYRIQLKSLADRLGKTLERRDDAAGPEEMPWWLET